MRDLPWTVKVESITDAIGQNACLYTCGCVWPCVLPVPRLNQQVIDGEVADINTSTRSCNAIPCLSCVFESLVHYNRLS